MYIDENSIVINNVSMGPYLSEVEYGYNKVWGPDSGRNLKGSMSGTFKGIIVKLKLRFIPTTQEELEVLAPILDSPNQTTTYYDPTLKQLTQIQTYTGDWATLNKNVFTNMARANESFDISIIATDPRV